LTMNGRDAAGAKIAALEAAGVVIASSAHLVGETIRLRLGSAV